MQSKVDGVERLEEIETWEMNNLVVAGMKEDMSQVKEVL